MLTFEAEEAFQFTTICFGCEDSDDDSLPLLQAQTAINSSSDKDSEGADSSIGSFLSMPSLNTNVSSSSNDNRKDEEEELAEDHRSDDEQGKFIFTNIIHIDKKVAQKGHFNKDWLLLDNQPTVNIMSNPHRVANTRKTGKHLQMGTYTGQAYTDMICDLGGWGTT
eukprot:15366242-Ditylum_brightwellii.AAC.1